MTLRLVHIGLGGWGRNWEELAVPRVPEIQRVACIDSDPATLATARETLGLPDAICFSDMTTALESVEADAVLITVQLAGHVSVALAALEAGKHVLVEKPFAPSVAEAKTVVEAAERRGLTLMVSQNYRFFPAPKLAERMVREQALGPLGAVHVDFRRYANTAERGGNRHYDLIHPLLYDMAIHHYDLLRMILAQEPVDIFVKVTSPAWSNFSGDAAAVMTITFAGGTIVSYRGSWVSTGPETAWAGEWRMECADGEIAWTSRNGEGVAGDRVTVQRIGRKHARTQE
ncbi:MAG: Gfo/Idh/MocA family oxidoreductase, partial [Chloroflexia bacterium]|nr:Gfo/Idh/MocA family oxidoreductase [Chloroflexia bacterium]